MDKLAQRLYPVLNWVMKKVLKRDISLNTARQFTKHYFAGISGSVLNYALFNVLKYAGLPTRTANIITGIVLIITMFTVQKLFTYKPNHHSLLQPALFIVNSVLYFFLDTLLLVQLIDRWLVDPKIAKLISLIMLSPMSFLFQKFIVFKNKEGLNAGYNS